MFVFATVSALFFTYYAALLAFLWGFIEIRTRFPYSNVMKTIGNIREGYKSRVETMTRTIELDIEHEVNFSDEDEDEADNDDEPCDDEEADNEETSDFEETEVEETSDENEENTEEVEYPTRYVDIPVFASFVELLNSEINDENNMLVLQTLTYTLMEHVQNVRSQSSNSSNQDIQETDDDMPELESIPDNQSDETTVSAETEKQDETIASQEKTPEEKKDD